MVESCGRLCQLLGQPRSIGQIYGLLYLSPGALSLDDIARLLQISKGSASMGARQLSAWGALRPVWVSGDRRDYLEAVADLRILIRGAYDNFVKQRIVSSGKRLLQMEEYLEEDRHEGVLSAQEYKLCLERIRNMSKMQKKIQHLAPLAEKLL